MYMCLLNFTKSAPFGTPYPFVLVEDVPVKASWVNHS